MNRNIIKDEKIKKINSVMLGTLGSFSFMNKIILQESN